MSLVLPIPLNTQLVTDQDLGRGFSIDENGQNAKKNQIYLSNKDHVVTSRTLIDQNNLTMIRDQESLKNALDVGGELSLSYGMISGKVMGNYIDNSFTGSEKLSFLYTRRIVSKVIQLNHNAQVAPGIDKIKNIEDLRSFYGQYYISKIEYGAMLDLKITLQSDDDKTLKQIKGELSGSVTFAAFSLSVKAHLNKTDESTKTSLNVTSNVYMAGCQQLAKADVKSMEDAQRLIDEFKVDEERLVPIRIEISPLPPTLTPLLSVDPISFRIYKSKLTQIGKNYWEFDQMTIQLDFFKKMIDEVFISEEFSHYVQNLMAKVSQLLTTVRKYLEETVTFMQDTIANILIKPIPYDDASITDLKLMACKLIGSTVTMTEIGNWFGSSVKDIPTYKGTYRYNNGTIYKGLCLNGKRNGKGIMTYPSGNIEQLVSVDGEWKDDEISYPTTIKYLDHSLEITTASEFISWKEDHKSYTLSDHVEFTNLTTSDQYQFRYRVNVDLIKDETFQTLFDQLRRSVDPTIDKYNFLFLGMAGSGKTTMIEYFLNVLTGQIHTPRILHNRDIESKESDGGERNTNQVCRYEIEYIYLKTFVFSITLLDTPGFTTESTKDSQHFKTILEKITGKIDRIDSVCYVTNGKQTDKNELESNPLRVFSHIYSVFPKEALESVTPIFTFSDDVEQVNIVKNIFDAKFDGFTEKPSFYLDNQWSQYLKDKKKDIPENFETNLLITSSNNPEDIETKLVEKFKVIIRFLIDIIRSKKSFTPKI